MSKGQLGNLQFFLFCYNNKNASCVSQRLEDPSGNKVSSVAQLQALMYMYSLELKTDTMDRSCGSWLERPLWAASAKSGQTSRHLSFLSAPRSQDLSPEFSSTPAVQVLTGGFSWAPGNSYEYLRASLLSLTWKYLQFIRSGSPGTGSDISRAGTVALMESQG